MKKQMQFVKKWELFVDKMSNFFQLLALQREEDCEDGKEADQQQQVSNIAY